MILEEKARLMLIYKIFICHYDSQEKGPTKDNKKNPSTILVSQKPSFASFVSYPKYSIYKVCLLTELGSLGV